VGIIVLAHFTNNEYGAGADHIVYGWGFNVAILLILGVIGFKFRDDVHETQAIRAQPPVSPARLAAVATIAALSVSVGPALAFWHDNRVTPSDLHALADPFQPMAWQQFPASESWRPSFSGFDAEARQAILPAGGAEMDPVDLYLAYYARPRPGRSMTAHVNRFWDPESWNLAETHSITAPFAGMPVRFQEWWITSHYEKRLVWSSYWVDGRFTTSLLQVKLRQSAAALRGHEGQAALVLSTSMERGPEDARRRLSAALAGLNQLPDRLNEANRPAPGGR
jgi:EpsI family protein